MLVLLDHDVSQALGIMNSYRTHPPLNDVKFAYVKLYQWQESPKSMVGDTTGVKILKKTDLFVPIFLSAKPRPCNLQAAPGPTPLPFLKLRGFCLLNYFGTDAARMAMLKGQNCIFGIQH